MNIYYSSSSSLGMEKKSKRKGNRMKGDKNGNNGVYSMRDNLVEITHLFASDH